MRTLNVQKITRQDLVKAWKSESLVIIAFGHQTEMYIRSDKFGNVNWDKAPVYDWNEIQKEQKRRPVHFTVPKEIFELP